MKSQYILGNQIKKLRSGIILKLRSTVTDSWIVSALFVHKLCCEEENL